MHIVMAIVAIALLALAGPASAAQSKSRTYTVSVSRHVDTDELGDEQARKILDGASRILKENGCDITFKLKGPVKTFKTRETPSIVNESNIEAVHRVDESSNADLRVKVVRQITEFCRGRSEGGEFNGCSWPIDFRSTIVVDKPTGNPPTTDPMIVAPLVWAHEFGHLMGIPHSTKPNSLMSGCTLKETDKVVTEDECLCYLSGPGVGGKCDLRPVGCQ